MSTRPLKKFVKRYTTLSSALQTLKQEKLVLLSPSKWDDANDAYFMDLYRSNSSVPSNCVWSMRRRTWCSLSPACLCLPHA